MHSTTYPPVRFNNEFGYVSASVWVCLYVAFIYFPFLIMVSPYHHYYNCYRCFRRGLFYFSFYLPPIYCIYIFGEGGSSYYYCAD